jgi:tRNA pseudouridine38-40 synthase
VRIAAGIEYKGASYCGWQSQRGVPTVQDCVEKALSVVADHPVRVVTAGRTDTGVHATGQVVHFDTDRTRTPRSWMRGANSNLPEDIRVHWARPVPDDFHARFRAVARSYRYIIHAAPTRPAVFHDLCGWTVYDLDLEAMRASMHCLSGRQDFSAFRAVGCQAKTPVRTVRSLSLERSGPWFWLDICADAFLQHMVRNIVGSLILVGRGERDTGWLEEVLGSRDRTRAGPAAPPEGLYLSEVSYPDAYGLPGPVSRVRFW